ncbi:hypothetical protein, partial [Deinococcus sp. GbtcB9]|uniref:hypothetical protein n=1 Tax=Deinococcus sp. GbtcB9 TaxID=2824754 RepID=UPI001C2FE37D
TSPPPSGVPVQEGLADVDMSGFTVDTNTRRGATPSDMAERPGLELADQQKLSWEQGEFDWNAHNAIYNDPRGFPVALGA